MLRLQMPRRTLWNIPPPPNPLYTHVQTEIPLDTLVHRSVTFLGRVAELDALVQSQAEMNPGRTGGELFELFLLVDEGEDVGFDDFDLTEGGADGLGCTRVGDVAQGKHVVQQRVRVGRGGGDLEGGVDVDEAVLVDGLRGEGGEQIGSRCLTGAHEHQIGLHRRAVLKIHVECLARYKLGEASRSRNHHSATEDGGNTTFLETLGDDVVQIGVELVHDPIPAVQQRDALLSRIEFSDIACDLYTHRSTSDNDDLACLLDSILIASERLHRLTFRDTCIRLLRRQRPRSLQLRSRRDRQVVELEPVAFVRTSVEFQPASALIIVAGMDGDRFGVQDLALTTRGVQSVRVRDERFFFTTSMQHCEAREGEEVVEVRVCFDHDDAVGGGKRGEEVLGEVHTDVGSAHDGDSALLVDGHLCGDVHL